MKKLLFLLFLFQVVALHGQGETVICLHGYFRSYRCLIPMANTLENEGFRVHLWDYPSRKNTIEGHADVLVKILQDIAHARPGQPIHFVTHSLGGIIVRAAVNHPNCPPEARQGRAILLAPPNKGAAIARRFKDWVLMRGIFGGKAGRQLLTFTEEEMKSIGSFPETMEVMVLAGAKGNRLSRLVMDEANDGKVTVDETRLSSPHIHKTLNVSHSWIMTSRESINLTKDFLLGRFPE